MSWVAFRLKTEVIINMKDKVLINKWGKRLSKRKKEVSEGRIESDVYLVLGLALGC